MKRPAKTKRPVRRQKSRPLKTLIRMVRRRIESGWTQRVMARDELGFSVPATSEKATCFCLKGAIDSVSPMWKNRICAEENAALMKAFHKGLAGTRFFTLTSWNDVKTRTKAQVLALCDLAYENA